MKLTSKQEKFAQNIVKGMTQSDAYRDAYDAENMQNETIWVESCKLMNNHNVSTRVEELRSEVIKGIKYEIEDCFAELSEAQQQCKIDGNYALVIKAIEDKAKLFGLLTEKKKVDIDTEGTLKRALVKFIGEDEDD